MHAKGNRGGVDLRLVALLRGGQENAPTENCSELQSPLVLCKLVGLCLRR